MQGGAWTEGHQEKTNSLAYDFAKGLRPHAAGFSSHQGPSHLILAQCFEVVNSLPHIYPGRRDGVQTTQARGRAQTFLWPSLQSWPRARVGGRNCGRGLPVPTHPHGATTHTPKHTCSASFTRMHAQFQSRTLPLRTHTRGATLTTPSQRRTHMHTHTQEPFL